MIEVDPAAGAESARWERRSNLMRWGSWPVLTAILAVVLFTSPVRGTVYLVSILAYALLVGLGQTLAAWWMSKARGEDDFDRKYWLLYGVVGAVAIV